MRCAWHKDGEFSYSRCHKLRNKPYHLTALLYQERNGEWWFEVRFATEQWKLLARPWWWWYWIDIPKNCTVKQAKNVADIFIWWMSDLLDSMYDICLELKEC